MNCPVCKYVLPGKVDVCPCCGTRLIYDTPVQQMPVQMQTPVQPIYQQQTPQQPPYQPPVQAPAQMPYQASQMPYQQSPAIQPPAAYQTPPAPQQVQTPYQMPAPAASAPEKSHKGLIITLSVIAGIILAGLIVFVIMAISAGRNILDRGMEYGHFESSTIHPIMDGDGMINSFIPGTESDPDYSGENEGEAESAGEDHAGPESEPISESGKEESSESSISKPESEGGQPGIGNLENSKIDENTVMLHQIAYSNGETELFLYDEMGRISVMERISPSGVSLVRREYSYGEEGTMVINEIMDGHYMFYSYQTVYHEDGSYVFCEYIQDGGTDGTYRYIVAENYDNYDRNGRLFSKSYQDYAEDRQLLMKRYDGYHYDDVTGKIDSVAVEIAVGGDGTPYDLYSKIIYLWGDDHHCEIIEYYADSNEIRTDTMQTFNDRGDLVYQEYVEFFEDGSKLQVQEEYIYDANGRIITYILDKTGVEESYMEGQYLYVPLKDCRAPQ